MVISIPEKRKSGSLYTQKTEPISEPQKQAMT